jgi:hypothetical protein
MGAIDKLKSTLGVDNATPRSDSDVCPWCGERVVSRSDRVVMDGREYHGQCSVARIDAGVLPAEGRAQPRDDL